jgi:hypothetical protein
MYSGKVDFIWAVIASLRAEGMDEGRGNLFLLFSLRSCPHEVRSAKVYMEKEACLMKFRSRNLLSFL